MHNFCRCSLVAALLFGASGAVRADFISNTLGAAGPGNFSLLALNGAQDIALNGPGTTNGTVGISSGKLSLDGSNGPSVNGNVLLGSGASVSHPNLVNGNVFTNQNLSQANTDARNAASTFSNLASTAGTPTSVNGNTTINGGPGVTVANLSGIKLGNGQALTLNGPAGSQFVINTPSLTLNSGHLNLTGGVTPNDVVYNVTGTGNSLTTSGGLNNESVINGTVLNAKGGVAMAPGLINGELIAGGQSIHLVSGASVNGVPPTPSVPEPASALLISLGGLGMGALARRNSRRKELDEAVSESAPAIVS